MSSSGGSPWWFHGLKCHRCLLCIWVMQFSVIGYTSTGGFHNFNLRIVNLRVSNPDNLMVDVFFWHDVGFQCARVSAQQKRDEISEIDRIHRTLDSTFQSHRRQWRWFWKRCVWAGQWDPQQLASIYICIYVCIYIYICICVVAYMYIYIYI